MKTFLKVIIYEKLNQIALINSYYTREINVFIFKVL